VRSPILSIKTTVTGTIDFEGGQKSILDNTEERMEQIHSLHNQLVELVGVDNIFHAEITEDRRPERGWKKTQGSSHEPPREIPELLGRIPERATYLCRYPVKIEVTAGYVRIKKKKYRILQWGQNVERISGGWFEKPQTQIQNTFDRNYYYVELEGFQKVTIFETPEREFYLHGYYG
jgi:hypothetical protein